MRILEIAPPWIKPFPPTSYGAIERVVWELGEAMKRQGAEVGYATEEHEILLALENADYDFAHAHTPQQAAYLREIGSGYIATCHWHQLWYDTSGGAEAREMVDLAEGHLALGFRMWSGRKCAVMGQGVNAEAYPKRGRATKVIKESGRVLMVGSYLYGDNNTVNPVERKRYRHGIKWLALDPTLNLTIAGPGVQQMIYDICDDEGVDPTRVELPGNLGQKDLVGLMHESTVLLHAATQECIALVPLEAMSAGLPVICATPANEYGDAVETYDHWEHLPAALETVLANYTARVRDGRKYAESKTWDRVAENALSALGVWLEEREEEKVTA